MIFIDLWLLCNHGLWHVTQCAFLVKTGKGIVHCPEGMYSVCVCVCRVLKGKRLIWGLRWEEEDTKKCERGKALWNELLFVSSMLVEDCQSYWLFFHTNSMLFLFLPVKISYLSWFRTPMVYAFLFLYLIRFLRFNKYFHPTFLYLNAVITVCMQPTRKDLIGDARWAVQD